MAGFLSGLDLRTARRGRIATAPRVRMQERHFIDEYEIHGTPRAVRNNVLVKVAEAEEVTSGGLILATVAVEKPNYGTVISTGTGYSYATTGFKVPMVVKEGDTVMYGKYGFEPLQIDDEEHAVVSQDAVLAKVNGEYKAENVEPIYDTIFIRRDDADESLSSGVVLSARAKIKPNTGKILAVGPGRLMESGKYEESPYKVGDRVCLGDGAGTMVKFEGAEHILARQVEILAKLTD